MNTAINNFTNQLHDSLEAVEDRVKSPMMEAAEAATLTAICNRMDAEAAARHPKKHS